MLYMLLPHEQHCDDGLGAMGDEFEEAGNALGEQPKGPDFRITRCYLYRHAIELYLKSVIVILHRGLSIPYGQHPHNGIGHVKVGDKWQPIHHTHSVKALWEYVRLALNIHKDELATRCKTDWQDIPAELDDAIEIIDKLDKTSTFFRYPAPAPLTDQTTKSAWREINIKNVNTDALPQKPVKMLLISDEADIVQAAFQYHADTLAEVLELLQKTANNLTGFHVGLRCELMGGR